MEERVLNSRRIHDGKIVNLRIDTVRLPDGHEASREVVEHAQAVAVVPVDGEGRIVFVRQYRLPVEAVLLEIPAGSVDADEDPETAAQRELREETGFRAGKLEKLTSFWVAPSYCTEFIHVYLATALTEDRLQGDEDERIETETLTLMDALARVDRGEIQDAKSICGLLQYARRSGSA